MTNLAHIQPEAPILGFRWETGTGGNGIAVIRGTATDQTKPAAAAATALLGVIDVDQGVPNVGDVVSVRLWASGEIAYVQAGAAIAVDALLTTDAAGKWVTCASTNKVLARALGPAAASGELIPVIFQDGDKAAP